MTINAGPQICEPSHTDRIALSNLLYELAEQFQAESVNWSAPDARAECQRTSRRLAEIARHTITGAADFAKAEAFSDAATVIIGNVIGARRFFVALLTEPSRAGA